MANPIADSAAAIVKPIIVKTCSIKRSISIELIKNKKKAANKINSIEMIIIIKCPLFKTTPQPPNNNNITITIIYL